MGFLGGAVVALLFPGQGSQHVGMGRALAEEFAEARAVFEEADRVLGFSLSRLTWEGPEEELTATQNAQPAILTHSIAVHRVLADRLPEIHFAAGHSLGEFTAYVAAGAMEFGDALRAVRRRGELMFRSGEERPGAMAAIVGLDDEAVNEACSRASLEGGGECVAANFNAPGQVVISGEVSSVQRASQLAEAAGARRTIPLNVSGAFHSPLMAVAEPGLMAALANVALERPAYPVVSNVTAEPVEEPVDARELLVRQLTAPVLWAQCIRRMRSAGVQRFIELGPGKVLTGLLKRIDRDARGESVGEPDDVRTFEGG